MHFSELRTIISKYFESFLIVRSLQLPIKRLTPPQLPEVSLLLYYFPFIFFVIVDSKDIPCIFFIFLLELSHLVVKSLKNTNQLSMMAIQERSLILT